ncbi:hypothetical protein [Methanococcus maripaludis]|uniref:Uncharacterized protein n=1 Tax=Methanococcus maripaludis OS7 TaxID=637915 RepID=A0A2Z5PIU6_METMI|nr:hypothetical protein [Methanococcus maripaludis]BAP62128.1 hypothetical protein MMOS7_00420 [Methanococcus maripaludis OS7]
MNNYFSFIDLILMNRKKVEHSGILVWGYRGMGKTTCLRGIYHQIEEYNKLNPRNSISSIFATDIDQLDICDCLFLDDFGTKFNKRDFSTTENKEFVKLLQEVRTSIPVIVVSSPSYFMLDKDLRNFFTPAQILSKSSERFLLNVSGAMFSVPKPKDELLKEFRDKELEERKERCKKSIEKVKTAHAKKNGIKS